MSEANIYADIDITPEGDTFYEAEVKNKANWAILDLPTLVGVDDSDIDQGDNTITGTLAWHVAQATKTVRITPGTFTVSQNITVPITMTLKPDFLGILADDGGNATLTINGPFPADPSQHFSWGTGSGAVAFGDGSVDKVEANWWGAIGDNNTATAAANAAAINQALATGKNVQFGNGTYYTTGLHRISSEYQNLYGANNTIIKKSANAAHLLDTVWGKNYVGLHDLTLDGNGKTGPVLIWRGHYSHIDNVHVTNSDETSFGTHFSGMNLSTIDRLNTDGLLIDQDTDPTYSPTYGALYSTFNNCSIAPAAAGARSALRIVGALVGSVTFNELYVETALLTEPSIYINGTNIYNLNFNDLQAEVTLGTKVFVEMVNSAIYSVHFKGGKILISNDSTKEMFDIDSVPNVSIEDMILWDTTSTSGTNTIIKLTGVDNSIIENNLLNVTANFTFIECSGVSNEHITERNNSNKGAGVGTNEWGTSNHIVSESSELLQTVALVNDFTMMARDDAHSQHGVGFVTVADDAYYDVYGDGGTTGPGSAISGFLMIGTGDITNGSENNAALLYVQTGGADTTAKATEISLGSNVEIDLLNDADAALATTTDGKLGVQIGGGNATQIFIRIYNRTGASITLFAHLNRMF